MSVDLATLKHDESLASGVGNTLGHNGFNPSAKAIQNVLDALNFYRCKSIFAEQELARANALLIETRNSADHNRIFGGHA